MKISLDDIEEVGYEEWLAAERSGTGARLVYQERDYGATHYYLSRPKTEPEKIPEEPVELGSIIRYSLSFKPSRRGIPYRFTAIKGFQGEEDKWFWSGATCPEKGVTWRDLMLKLKAEHHLDMPSFDIIWPPTRSRRVDL